MNFDDETVQKVWEKGKIIDKFDPAKVRKDLLGAWILRRCYGDRNSEYGWEIDPIDGNLANPDISNLRPLQWENKTLKAGNGFAGRVTSLCANNLRVK